MAPDGENFRGINAARVLAKENQYTLDKVIAAGYDTYMPAFEILVPALISAFEKNVPAGNMLYNQVHEAVGILKSWDYRAGEQSVAATLAIEWAQKLGPAIQRVYIDQGETDQVAATRFFAQTAGYDDLLMAFRGVVMELTEKFGTWKVPWGEINRYQRLSGNIKETYDDTKPSLPVGFASATWGCLPSYVSRPMPGTKKRYGTNGNSFICAVEFGPRIKAKSLLAGGVNSNPASPHFGDQAEMYTKGKFKDVLFYKEDVIKNAERTYIPGQ
jgi:acyl-homoserine lactone acylase PvdQ